MDPTLKVLLAVSACFFFVSLLFALFVLHCSRRSRGVQPNSLDPPSGSRNGAPLPRPEASISFDPSLPRLSMAELEAATQNFCPDCVIGDGGFGLVYKAQLSDGTAVAVKRLSPDAFNGFREFRAEVETLGHVCHPNLARILGYCASGTDRLLIYEFLERGSLDKWLHEAALSSSIEPLPWGTRLRVIRGVAAGLAFLHGECRPRIIHRDIKASNVLLDDGFEARITDFGLARRMESSRSHVSTQVAGTLGYMPPEYRNGHAAATAEADVYSFGALMFEVATGRRPNWPLVVEGKEVPLVRWARAMVEHGRGPEMLDSLMGREGMREEEVKGFLAVAYRCTSECAKDRPPMKEVLLMLSSWL